MERFYDNAALLALALVYLGFVRPPRLDGIALHLSRVFRALAHEMRTWDIKYAAPAVIYFLYFMWRVMPGAPHTY